MFATVSAARRAKDSCPGREPIWDSQILLLVCLLLFLLGSSAAQSQQVRRVLIFYDVGPTHPAVDLIDKGLHSALQASTYRLEFYTEYLETALFPAPADQRRIREFYLSKYKNRKPDVIVTAGPASLQFMWETHRTAFPGIPIVFCLPTGLALGSPVLDSDFTGVENGMSPAETVAVALRLQPNTGHIVVVGGTTEMDRQQETAVREGLKAYQGGFDISYLTDLAMPDLLERLRHLPNHTIVFFTAIGRDATGQRFISGSESARLVVAAANAPVFSFYDIHINHGEVGGDLSSLTEQGRLAGAILLEVLRGKRPQDIPRAKGTTAYTFDWQALKRWGMGEKTLPPGSIVLNRQQIVWEDYKWYVIVGTSLILLQTFLISALLWQRTRRKKAEGELEDALAVAQESEHRFRHVANTAPVMIWMSGPDKLRTYVNQPWLDLTGRRLTEELGNGWLKSIHFEDVKTCFNNYSQAFDRRESFTMQYRVRQHGGDYRWVLDRGVPRFNADDSFAGYIGSCVDITDRKQAEEALSTVSRRLIDAQEQERTRIARELHDDISQRIALLGIDLDVLQQSLPDSAVELHSRLDEARQRASEIGSEVQAISHRLHSSKLEYLGLVAACRSFCNEVAARHRVTLDFSAEGIPSSVPPDVSLCLFRVLQEALNNTIKHSGAEHSEVELRGTPGEIQLTVRDNGVGFDGTTAVISRGLGLISMRERVSFVNGTLLIASKPTVGTEITVRAPLIQAASRAPSGAA